MKKVLFTLSLAGIFGTSAFAQLLPCGTDEMYKKQVAAHPEILELSAKLNAEIASKVANNKMSEFAKTTDEDGTTVYHVPLVFHIIHDFGTEYVTDAAIVACVNKINTMYNKTNADTSEVIAPFKGFINNSKTRYIGNTRIMWHLATKDPDGKPTNGITRRRTYLTRFGGEFAKYDQWPSTNYMNIWLINQMSAAHSKAAAYAYKPPTGETIPYYDGIIGMASYVNEGSYTYSHELGHELNLDHVWGGTNDPEVGCGDDDVNDTPPTKGHLSCGTGPTGAMWDTACLYSRNVSVAKIRVDSIRRADSSVVIVSDNSTTKGISFRSRTASTLDSFSFYPTAPVGSTYKIGLSKNGVLIDSISVVTTVTGMPTAQRVAARFKVMADTSRTSFYKLFFLENNGALKDTVTPAISRYSTGVNGSIFITSATEGNFYNFFYDWKITYGYFKIFGDDSLVDYPDTTNTQNVMDYSFCSHMFTAGQSDRMRAALTATGPGSANRANLITEANLLKTGIDAASLATPVALAPKAEFSVEPGISSSSVPASERSYFLCAESDAKSSFVFQNRTWQATPTSVNWTLTNGATVPTSTSTTKVTTKFAEPGWAKITMTASNAVGSESVTDSVYVADPTSVNPIGFWQEFNDANENKRWPTINYYNNQYAWSTSNRGYYDNTSMRYKSYDVRTFPSNLTGDPAGDFDDFFTPAFDLSGLGATNGNLNFMYAGSYATNDFSLMKDVLEIAYSTDCGSTWALLTTMANEKLQTVGSTGPGEYLSLHEDWLPKSINLKNGTTNIRGSKVFFRFRYKPSARTITGQQGSYAAGNNFYIDRINISDNPLTVNEMLLGERKATVAPNPTNSNAFVLFQKPNAHVSIQVMDITGKVVYTINTKVDQANDRIEIPASYLGAKGVYMVRITGDENLNQTEKLIVY